MNTDVDLVCCWWSEQLAMNGWAARVRGALAFGMSFQSELLRVAVESEAGRADGLGSVTRPSFRTAFVRVF